MKKLSTAIFLVLCSCLVAFPSAAAEFDRLVAEKRFYGSEMTRVKFKVLGYVINHPWPSAAIIATGGGLAAFLQSSMDETTKNLLVTLGIIGAAYCIDNAANVRECAAATAELLSYAAEMDGYQRKLDYIDSQILLLQPFPPPPPPPPPGPR